MCIYIAYCGFFGLYYFNIIEKICFSILILFKKYYFFFCKTHHAGFPIN